MDKSRFFAIVQKVKQEGLNSAASDIADSKMPEFVFFAFWTRSVASDTDTAGRAWMEFIRQNSLPACKLTEDEAIDASLRRLNNQGSRPQRAICVVKIRTLSARWDKWAEDWVVSGLREAEIVEWHSIPITRNEFGIYYLDPQDDD